MCVCVCVCVHTCVCVLVCMRMNSLFLGDPGAIQNCYIWAWSCIMHDSCVVRTYDICVAVCTLLTYSKRMNELINGPTRYDAGAPGSLADYLRDRPEPPAASRLTRLALMRKAERREASKSAPSMGDGGDSQARDTDAFGHLSNRDGAISQSTDANFSNRNVTRGSERPPTSGVQSANVRSVTYTSGAQVRVATPAEFLSPGLFAHVSLERLKNMPRDAASNPDASPASKLDKDRLAECCQLFETMSVKYFDQVRGHVFVCESICMCMSVHLGVLQLIHVRQQ
jgi:hypothetical protein